MQSAESRLPPESARKQANFALPKIPALIMVVLDAGSGGRRHGGNASSPASGGMHCEPRRPEAYIGDRRGTQFHIALLGRTSSILLCWAANVGGHTASRAPQREYFLHAVGRSTLDAVAVAPYQVLAQPHARHRVRCPDIGCHVAADALVHVAADDEGGDDAALARLSTEQVNRGLHVL